MTSLTAQQRDLAAMVADFTAARITPHAVAWDRDQRFPREVFEEAAALGMGGIFVDEQFGGSALSRVDGVLIFEAMAAGCPSTSAYLSIHNMVAWMIDRFGTSAQRSDYLPRMCAMQLLGAYCLTEPDAGSDAAALRSTAVAEGDSYRLDGVKQFISGAGVADVYVVMARTADSGARGISAFLVDRTLAGVSFGPNESKMGWKNQPTRQVILSGVRVPATARLGHEGQGFSIAMSGLNGGRLNIAACSLGGAGAALSKSLTHLRDRHAFGVALNQFQALQFQLADMATELEASRLLLLRAAGALDDLEPGYVELCAMAKRFVTDVGFEVANRALQLHGGYGYLTDYGIEKLVRDLRVHQILEGTNEIMRMIIARGLLKASS